jgi:hypothetical protein
LRTPPFPADGAMLTNPGRSWFADPRPYSTQLPMLGRTKLVLPQCRNRVAGPWATPSVCSERTKHRSSMCRFTSGNRSDAQVPVWPCCENVQSGFITRWLVPRAPVLANARASSNGICLPSSFSSRGL